MNYRMPDFLQKMRFVLSEAFLSFRKNNDLTAASSLAFSAMLALVPSLFLVTALLSMAIGSSAQAFARTEEFARNLLPAYSQVIMQEVHFIGLHTGTISLVNGIILFWAVTPLVSDMRRFIGIIFRKKPGRPFLLEKLFDIAISMVFLIGISTVAVVGISLKVMAGRGKLFVLPNYLETAFSALLLLAVVFLIYLSFSPRKQARSLMTGAIITSLLWFAMRPAFHLFLTYNPGYGFAFGSFKSLFVVIIWIYYSLAVFLFGAEVAAIMSLKDMFVIKKLMGRRNVPSSVFGKHVVRFEKGNIIFTEGDEGREMYSVLAGRVGILKNDQEIAVIEEGKCFGVVAFLLSKPRGATAVALDEVELVRISNDNIRALMSEFPEFVLEMLRDMAKLLQAANRLVD